MPASSAIGIWISVGALLISAGSLAVSYFAFRRSGNAKVFDARLELRKAEVDLEKTIDSLEPLMRKALGSRTASLAANGLARSGAHDAWRQAMEEDLIATSSLHREARALSKLRFGSKLDALENRRVAVHRLGKQADALAAKYQKSLDDDERAVEKRRAEAAARSNRVP